MPLRHGIEVHVTNTDLEPLIEYGSQNLGNSACLSKIVSTRIEAKDGLQFYIHIRTEFPFPLKKEDLVDSEIPAASAFSFDPNIRGFRDPYPFRHAKRWVDNTHIEEQEDIENQTDKHNVNTGTSASTRTRDASAEELPNILAPLVSKLPTSSKVPSREHAITHSTSDYQMESIQETQLPAYPPFDLTASVYIDGHEKPECRQVIYLNPNHRKFYSGGFVFKGRWVSPPPPAITDDQAALSGTENCGAANNSGLTSQSDNAHISIRNWVFQSVPMSIDSLTDRFMTICSAEKPNEATSAASQSEADRLLNDLTSTLSSNNDMLSAIHRPKPGQIEVRIRRIVTGTPTSKIPFKAYHYAGADESVDPLTIPTCAKNEEDLTHTTSLRAQVDAATGQEAKMKLNTVPWRSYRKNEDVYAKFMFNYSSRPKLVSLGLCDEMGMPTVATAKVNVPDMRTPFERKRVAGGSGRDDENSENSENNEEYSMTSKTKQPFGQTRTSVPQIETGRIIRSAKRRLSGLRAGEPMQTRQRQNAVDFGLPEENKENKEAWRQQNGLSSDEDDD